MPAHQRDLVLIAGGVQLLKDPLDQRAGGAPLRQKQRDQQPARRRRGMTDRAIEV